jgi:subtilisin family serine protease
VKLFLLVLVLAVPTAAPPSAAAAERSAALSAELLQGAAGQRHLVWVFLRDKGPSETAAAPSPLTPRAVSRRQLRGRGASPFLDLPVAPAYLEAVGRTVSRVRHPSRWFNAVSVEATRAQVAALEALPFVARLDVVRRYRRREEPVARQEAETGAADKGSPERSPIIDYGTSLGQLQQIRVPAVHERGYTGAGTIVAVFDAGFNTLSHEAFSTMLFVAAHDFVNGDDDVGDGSDMGEGSHGTQTLSVVGGFRSGQLVGPAFGASFILAKTENTDSETPVEEDNWTAAAEWAEALGADVISSSLGYLDFDAPFPSYTFQDMNGQTAISTLAAELAAERGVVVVNSAGNAGFNPSHNTLGAPADGAHVLSIAAVTSAGVRATFSSVGPTSDGRIKPDLAAQGVSVKAARPGSASLYTSVSGTSFSCPLTAGVVSLLLQANPRLTPDQVGAVLRGTAGQRLTPDNLLGWGIVNAEAAVRAVVDETSR